MEAMLEFLARDIAAHPEHVKSISADLIDRARTLTRDVKVDLNAPLDTEDE